MMKFVSDEPFINEVQLSENDNVVIIGCDGVWDEGKYINLSFSSVVSDQMAVDVVKNEKDPFYASTKLRDLAYLLGSDDNISVMSIAKFHRVF